MSSEGIITKVQKYVDQLKPRNTKLTEENAKLNSALADAKSSNSRIRRIPKKVAPADAAAVADPPADAPPA